MKTLAKAGKDGLQKAYNQCRTHDEKRAFFYDKYLLDPEVSEKAVLKKDTQESVVTEDNIDDWFTAEQVAKFKGIEPGAEHFKELVKASVKDLPERDHEDENLAALGVKQYHYQATKTKTQTLKRKGLELMEQVGDVSTEDFTDMRAAMNPGTGQRMIGSSTSKQQKALEDKESSLHKANEMNLEESWTQAYKDSQKRSAPRSRRRKSTRFQHRKSTRSRRLFTDIDNMITSTTRTKSTAVSKSTTQKH